MKSINLHFDLKTLINKFKSNTASALYLILAGILIMEIFSFYGAGKQILLARKAPEGLPPSIGVRLNFSDYEGVAKRIEAGKNFFSDTPLYDNPFINR